VTNQLSGRDKAVTWQLVTANFGARFGAFFIELDLFENNDFAPTLSVWPKVSGRRGRPHKSFLHE